MDPTFNSSMISLALILTVASLGIFSYSRESGVSVDYWEYYREPDLSYPNPRLELDASNRILFDGRMVAPDKLKTLLFAETNPHGEFRDLRSRLSENSTVGALLPLLEAAESRGLLLVLED